ncbi:MAG TPA: HAD family hydrolase [Ktedonobacterales bacterium]
MNHAFPPALLLDLDDTILADSLGVDACWDAVCHAYAPDVAPFTVAQMRAAIDDYRRWYWDDSARHRDGRLDLDAARAHIVTESLRRVGMPEECAAVLGGQIAADFSAMRDERLAPLPGALETVDALARRGVRLALLTNGAATAQRRKIERFDLARHFEVIIVEGEFGCGKPDPRVYQHALAMLAIAPTDAWMVGDNLEWDVFAPQRLGISGVWVNPTSRPLPDGGTERPTRTVRALADLLA